MGHETQLWHSAIKITFGIIVLAIMTSAPFFYYKINNQQPGERSTAGVTFAAVLILGLIGTIIPVYNAKVEAGLEWDTTISAMVHEFKFIHQLAMTALQQNKHNRRPDQVNIPG